MVRRFGPKAVCAVGLGLVTVGLAGFAFVGADTPLWVLIVLTFVQGAGMANVVPPATESIMSSLPREKAGVGSAVSNTVRQVGGALGVAVLGSVLAAVYRGEIGDRDRGAARAGPGGRRESISGAYGVAAQAGPGRAPRSIDRGQRRVRHRDALGRRRLGAGRLRSASSWCWPGCPSGPTRTTRRRLRLAPGSPTSRGQRHRRTPVDRMRRVLPQPSRAARAKLAERK